MVTLRLPCTVTAPAGEALNFQPGDWVDFYRPSGAKDKSGWQLRATVIENLPSKGQVTIRYKGPEILVRYPDVRRHLDFSSLTYMQRLAMDSAKYNAVQVIQEFLKGEQARHTTTLGYVCQDGRWQMSTTTVKYKRVALALDFVIQNLLNYSNIFAARLGKKDSIDSRHGQAQTRVFYVGGVTTLRTCRFSNPTPILNCALQKL